MHFAESMRGPEDGGNTVAVAGASAYAMVSLVRTEGRFKSRQTKEPSRLNYEYNSEFRA